MSFVANQYNYATPLSSVSDFGGTHSDVPDKKYFTLANNVLDGSYYPASGDVGLWGTAVSDSNGNLSSPFIISVEQSVSVNAFLVRGSQYTYPVDFTVVFLNGNDTVHTLSVVDNDQANYLTHFSPAIEATGYVLTITKISSPSNIVQIFNTYTPDYVKRSDNLSFVATDVGVSSELINKMLSDSIDVVVNDTPSAITNVIDVTHDTLAVQNNAVGTPINVHTVMKAPSRRIYGKVYITFTDPMLASSVTYTTSSTAYGSDARELNDGVGEAKHKYFTLYDNNLSGEYTPIGDGEQTGWVSGQLSGPDGVFASPEPYVKYTFSERPIVDFAITFDDSRGALVRDFTIAFIHSDGRVTTRSFTNNTLTTVPLNEVITNVVGITLTVYRVAKEGYPAVIVEAPIMSTRLYVGYKDKSNLVSIDLLEELSYDDDIEALGGVSANEVTVTLDNSSREFFFNNANSLISGSLKRNRKIVPWLGVEIANGEIEWYTLGTFWSYDWSIPVEGLTARVVGFDTLGLLDTTSFTNHMTLIDHSIGELIEYVIEDARTSLDFLEYKIDKSLFDVVIPYAWFDNGSHTAALRKIAGCYPVHIYCDRDGVICAAAQQLDLGYHYDVWSNSTNVISTKYSSLYTTLPNIVNITVHSPSVVFEEALATDELLFNVTTVPERTLNFNKPFVSTLGVTMDCDDTVQYIYKVYSWGIEFFFTGRGNVRSITCSGMAVDIGNSAIISKRDANSIRLNGAVTRDIASDFIQSSEHAALLISRIDSLSERDMYDATVEYRGDISISINDPIILQDGIAPTNKYNIKRHELYWDGALSGSAYLNT